MGIMMKLGRIIFVLCLPLFLISSNVRWLALNQNYYEATQAKYAVSEHSGLSQWQISAANKALIAFFQTPSDTLPQQLQSNGLSPSFFKPREVAHLFDVRSLIYKIGDVQLVSALYLVLFLLVGYWVPRSQPIRRTASNLLLGSGVTVLTLLAVYVFSLIDFGGLFRQFHLLSFRNDYWLLDPNTDNLIKMFPEEFWMDAVRTLALLCSGESLALGGLAGGVLLWVKRR
ncbi:MAG: TIGR01906 family membrane protein [Chloroflexi bacterium]|nr:TIGR01906 family membrane protein [Chloroflexota bacterium]